MRNTSKLKLLFDRLGRTKVKISTYPREMEDVVFDVIEMDTFIAGLASCVLENERIESDHLQLLRLHTIEDGSFWTLTDGSRVDLRPYPELLAYALTVHDVKMEVARLLRQ